MSVKSVKAASQSCLELLCFHGATRNRCHAAVSTSGLFKKECRRGGLFGNLAVQLLFHHFRAAIDRSENGETFGR